MVRLVSQGPGEYVSENDPEIYIRLDDTFETECDEPHPVRIRRDSILRYSDWYQRELLARDRSGGGKYITYMCEGNETHFYSMWVAHIPGGWTEDVYETFADARDALAKEIGEEITVVHPRKPKAMEETEDAFAQSLENSLELIQEIWRDELRGINEALVYYEEFIKSDDVDFVDQRLHEFHLKRKSELEALLL